ncbi:MAG: hypothetical protein NC489_17220 [Ruminococcus flavefaciens]|nr:hypothetical protein [Ruminococcus flavefaciens]
MRQNTKRIILFIAATIISLRIIYIFAGGEIDKEYFVSQEADLFNVVELPCKDILVCFSSNHDRLQCIEVLFSGIAEGETGEVIFKIMSEEDLIYQASISLSNVQNWQWQKIYVNAELVREKYQLYLNASDDCLQIPNVLIAPKEQVSQESTTSYAAGVILDGNIVLQYGYLQPPSFADKCVISSLWLFLLLATILFLHHFEQISAFVHCVIDLLSAQMSQCTLNMLAEIFFCMVILECSGVNFQSPTKILLYLLSVCAMMKLQDKRRLINDLFNTPFKKGLLYVLYLYAAFSLVGQRILAYPLDLQVTLTGLFVFIVTILWFIPVIQSVYYYLECLTNISLLRNPLKNRAFLGGIFVLVLILPTLYNLYANNPGISSLDSALTLAQNAHHLRGSDNWHPFFYNALLATIISVWDSTYAVIAIHYLFWIYVMLEFFFYLKEKGMRDSILICVALFNGFNAANIIHLNTIWKDIPYALSLLWLFVIMVKFSFDSAKYRKNWYIYFELFFSLIGVFFFRKNGIVPFVLTVLMLILILRKNIKIWCTLVITGIVIMLIQGPIYSHFEVIDNGSAGMYIGLSQDILGVYYSGGEISESTLQMINVMTGGNNHEYYYIPSWAYQTYDLQVKPQTFILNYVDTFIKNPILMFRALINREDALWNIYAGEGSMLGCVNYHGTMDGQGYDWNLYYPERNYVSLYNSMSKFTNYTVSSQWISAIEWRCGLFTLLGLIAIIYLALKKGIVKCLLIATPVIGQILSLVLSTGWSDFRYFWPLNLMNLFLLLVSITVTQEPLKN